MSNDQYTRRSFLRSSAGAAAGLTLAGLSPATRAAAQGAPYETLNDARFTFVSTTESSAWQAGPVYKPSRWDTFNLNLNLASEQLEARSSTQTIEGFGGCFTELGWVSLSALGESEREGILRELFHPTEGTRFTYCRTPIAANDFSTEAYSYDETDGDFALKHFSVDHDRKTLIPFIKAAQRHQKDLKLWASPWSPPTWMKRNHFYAMGQARPGYKENGIRPDQVGHEGEDMFIQEARYFQAYAEYFGRYIDAYRNEGINIGMVMPQNEFNSVQNFPSCTWTPAGLARLITYLGPQMDKRSVAIFFGTLERGNPQLLASVLADKGAAKYIKGVGVQWAGKNALPAVHRMYPDLPIFQSEQECGDGSNSWSYMGYCWQLMKHYFRSGVRGYMYWNLSASADPTSTWGWKQNSLVSVDMVAKTFKYNHDFYLMKHLTHFVDVGARVIEVTGTCDDALGFVNPDRTVVVLLRNEFPHVQMVKIQIGDQVLAVKLAPDSISTMTAKIA